MAVPTVNAGNAVTARIAVAGTAGRTGVPVGTAGMIAVTGARAAKVGAAPSALTAGTIAGMTAGAAGQTIAAIPSVPAQNGTASVVPPRSAPVSARSG